MATTANLAPGAIPTNGIEDPFTSAAAHTPLRYAALDNEQISLFTTNSPSQARRALEAHLKDTDRRIQDASKLGTTLLQQRKDLSARLDEVKQVQNDGDVPAELRKKLADLEKEYNEVGRESARAFLPKSRVLSTGEAVGTPSAYTGSGRESPTKMTAPSRRQRNQPSTRVHDIEFATEISTSLLAQVRQLQTALAEKDESLKDTNSAKAQIETDMAALAARVKHMDENEQRYKDENWNLETRLQELESNFKLSADREQKLGQSLKSTQSDKAAAQRDLDDLRLSHNQLTEEHAAVKRQQEADLFGLRRDATAHESERQRLQKRVEELTSQNTELAKAVSSRWNQAGAATDTDFVSADEEQNFSDGTPEHSEPASPVKGTPRHGMLESETLKSSLNHAHRMIQNLKNNIHREKTEKIELKRMLQDARDELEARRSETGIGANMARKRKTENDAKFRKPARPSALGANRNSTTEILEDEPDWEDHDGPGTPSRSRDLSLAVGAAALGGVSGMAVSEKMDSENTDDFETATEREGTTTDAFETGREDMDEDSDELTETESGANRRNGVMRPSPLTGRAGDRRSISSTASTSAGENEDEGAMRTPLTASQPKYKLRMNRGSKRSRVGDLAADSPQQAPSPSSSMGTPQPAGQSLGDELDALDDASMDGTPSRYSESASGTPQTQRLRSVEPDTPEQRTIIQSIENDAPNQRQTTLFANLPPKPAVVYADAGIMTEPWEPEKEVQYVTEESALRDKAEGVVGGALAGFGLGWFGRGKDRGSSEDPTENEQDDNVSSSEPTRPTTALGNARSDEEGHTETSQAPEVPEVPEVPLAQSRIVSQETVPILPPPPPPVAERSIEPSVVPAIATGAAGAVAGAAIATTVASAPQELGFSSVIAQDLEPVEDAYTTPSLPQRSLKRMGFLYVPPDEEEPIPGTEGSRPGAGFFALQDEDCLKSGPEKANQSRQPLGEVSSNITSARDLSMGPVEPLQVRKPVIDEGCQTAISGDEIETMLRNKSRSINVIAPEIETGTSPARPSTAIGPGSARSIDAFSDSPMRTPRRPASANSLRNKGEVAPPPLPKDHTQKIAAAQKAPGTSGSATAGTMGPPLMPASAYRNNRPGTPTGRAVSRDGTTPRHNRAGRVPQSPAGVSRRSSVSSFASEIDERFNLPHGGVMYPDDVKPATDPRMIQAITQTMIGEYLWKYTRKAGRSETSSTRHRRFFWVHPYTRTLYWSEKDPSAAGRDMLKAKSVAIEHVRVITDDNAYPPGLHRKSLVVVTPGREIVFTAPTGQRHETWFNALSYLLLRTEHEKRVADDASNQYDPEEFNPSVGTSVRRSISRITGRSHSRVSLSSYNSRTTRNESPTRIVHDAPTLVPSLAQRQSAAAARASATTTPEPLRTRRESSSTTTANRGRLSSLTQKFRPGSTATRGAASGRGRPSVSGRVPHPTDPSDIYDASVVDDSAEDLRAVIARQEQDADRLENVRACCDGKHDVGSLSHRGRHHSLSTRFGSGSHAHTSYRSDTMNSRTG